MSALFPGDSTREAMPSADGSPTLANPSPAISDASQFREPSLRFDLEAGRTGVFGGVTHGGIPAHTRITIGEHTSATDLQNDWTITPRTDSHGFPQRAKTVSLDRGGHCDLCRAGRTHSSRVAPGGGGLERDAARHAQRLAGSGRKRLGSDSFLGQHLLGGASFCLLADVQFRERTSNKRGLQHALRGILKAGGTLR
jgi:hypothetical protein